MGLLPGPVPHAGAAITAPALEVYAVEAERGETGIWIRVEGTFLHSDQVQTPLEIQIVVRQLDGDRFVRFVLSKGAFEGAAPAIRGGLTLESLPALEASSTPSESARLLFLGPNVIELLVPSDFPSGRGEAQLVLIYRGDPLFSNPLPFDIRESSSSLDSAGDDYR